MNIYLSKLINVGMWLLLTDGSREREKKYLCVVISTFYGEFTFICLSIQNCLSMCDNYVKIKSDNEMKWKYNIRNIVVSLEEYYE